MSLRPSRIMTPESRLRARALIARVDAALGLTPTEPVVVERIVRTKRARRSRMYVRRGNSEP